MSDEMGLELLDTEKKEVADTSAERTRERLAFVPRADIYETGDALHVVVDMPDVDADSIDVTLENGVLTIDGYVDPMQPEGHSLAFAEYGVGDYERAFKLSNEIDRDGIKASINDGVLRLYLPKISEAKVHRIAIKAE